MTNYIAFCMDSLRWDIFHEANAPNFHKFTDYKRVYSLAGCTVPSIFSTFMNLPWYEGKGEKLIPPLKSWAWIPTDLANEGYHTAFLSSNPMFRLYKPLFLRGFDTYEIFGSNHSATAMINKTIQYFKRSGPKFAFLLFMETHHPYVNPSNAEYRKKYPIKYQRKSVELLDKEFGRLVKAVTGTDTNIIVFADHGDLDLEREGDHGHGPGRFHRKLFEIPLGRKTI